jgi:exodeoxyribonuclease-3
MSTLKLLSWNVNGIRAAEKKGFIDWLRASDADIVAVQETKAHPDQLSAELLAPAGYTAHWASAEKKGYSGVATFVKHDSFAAAQVLAGLNDMRFDHEGRVLIHEFEPFVFFNIYFPNGGRGPEWVQHKLRFYKRFIEVAQGYIREGRSVIVTGDVNTAFAEIDLARPKENGKTSGFMPEERAGLQEIFDAGFVDTFRALRPAEIKYSWWNQVMRGREKNIGWRIDYFLVSHDLMPRVVDADCLCDVMGSDHCPVSLVLKK